MFGVSKRINIKELSRCFKARTDILRRFHLRNQFLLFYTQHPDRTQQTDSEESQFIGNIGAVFIKNFQHTAVSEGAQCIEQTVDDRDYQCNPALSIVVIGCILPGTAQILVLIRFYKAESNYTDTHECYSDKGNGRKIIPDSDGDQGQYRNDRSGTVADR